MTNRSRNPGGGFSRSITAELVTATQLIAGDPNGDRVEAGVTDTSYPASAVLFRGVGSFNAGDYPPALFGSQFGDGIAGNSRYDLTINGARDAASADGRPRIAIESARLDALTRARIRVGDKPDISTNSDTEVIVEAYQLRYGVGSNWSIAALRQAGAVLPGSNPDPTATRVVPGIMAYSFVGTADGAGQLQCDAPSLDGLASTHAAIACYGDNVNNTGTPTPTLNPPNSGVLVSGLVPGGLCRLNIVLFGFN